MYRPVHSCVPPRRELSRLNPEQRTHSHRNLANVNTSKTRGHAKLMKTLDLMDFPPMIFSDSGSLRAVCPECVLYFEVDALYPRAFNVTVVRFRAGLVSGMLLISQFIRS